MKTDDGRVYVFLALFCFLLYGGTLSYSLSWLDDYFLLIEAKPFLSSLKNLPALFFTDAFITSPIGLYRPLLNVSFMWDTLLNNLTGGWFFTHLNNILLHIVSVCLFYRFLRIFSFKTKTASVMMSIIFAAHPAASVAVGWIPGRNDLLLAVFAFSSFIILDKYRENGEIRHIICYSVLLLLSLFTKESAVALPFLGLFWLLICLFEEKKGFLLSLRQSGGSDFKADFNVFALFSIIPLLFWALMRHLSYIGKTEIVVSATLHNFLYLPEIIGHTLFPAWPVSVSPYQLLPNSMVSVVIFVVFFLFFAVFAVKMTRKFYLLWKNNVNLPENSEKMEKKAKKNTENVDYSSVSLFFVIVFGILWFLMLFIPTLAAGEGISSGSSFFEHRLYLPLAGFLLAIGIAANEIPERRKTFSFALSVVFLLFFSAVSFCHLGNYEDRYVFWQQAVQDSPEDFSNFVRAGQFEEQRGLDGQAEYFYIRAIEMNPAQSMLHASLAGIYYRRGDYAAAEAAMQSELQISPDCQKCHDWLAALRKQKLAIGN